MKVIGYFNETDNKFHLIKCDYISGESSAVAHLKRTESIKNVCDIGINIHKLKDVSIIDERYLSNYNDVQKCLSAKGFEFLKYNYFQNNFGQLLTNFNIDEWLLNDCKSMEVVTDKLVFTHEYFRNLFPKEYDNNGNFLHDTIRVYFRYKSNIYYVIFNSTDFEVSVCDSRYDDFVSHGRVVLSKLIKEGMYRD